MNDSRSHESSSPQKVSQSDDRKKSATTSSSSAGVKPRLIANYDPIRQEEIRRANRVAAMECRKRKKMLTQNLEITLENVKNENQILKGQYNALAAMVGQLKFQRMCQTIQNQQIQPQTTNLMSQVPTNTSSASSSQNSKQSADVSSPKLDLQSQSNSSSKNPSTLHTSASTNTHASQRIPQQPVFQFAPPNILPTNSNPPRNLNMIQNPMFVPNMQQTPLPLPYMDPFFLQRMQLQLQEQMTIHSLYSYLANMGHYAGNNLQSAGGFMPIPVQDMSSQGQSLNSLKQATLIDEHKKVPSSNDVISRIPLIIDYQ